MTAIKAPNNDDLINELARRVFVKTLRKIEVMVDASEPCNPERLHALAAVCEASACGFTSEDEQPDDEDAF